MSENHNQQAQEASDETALYDVIVVGYGPGALVATAALGALGVNVLAVERQSEPYPLPRAVTFDAEAARTIKSVGADLNKALANSTVLEDASFLSEDGQVLFALDWSGEEFGFARRRSIFQPEVEAALHDRVTELPSADVVRGTEVCDIVQHPDHVAVTVRPTAGGQSRTLLARYVVGADGANSFVRSVIDPPMMPLDYHSSLLNFDTEILRPLSEKFAGFRWFMDPARPHMFMPIGSRRQRFEMAILPDDTEEFLMDPETPWRWLREKWGLTKEDVKISRQVIYKFGSKVAEQWRDGRVFLVGDAAHSMSPGMGQGACSSIRDARNLSWKLAMVLKGQADESLLDTFQAEMKPFVTQIVMAAEGISRVAQIRDADLARERDERLRSGGVPAPIWPKIESGFVSHTGANDAAGRPSPQGMARRQGHAALGDELLGNGFQLVARTLPDGAVEKLKSLFGPEVGFASLDAPAGSEYGFEDLDGSYRSYLDEQGADFYIARPDSYVFAAGTLDQLDEVLGELAAALGAGKVTAPC